jgi:peptidoglycan-N-acetylglucosamine deacetylase
MRLYRPCFIAGWAYPDALFTVKTDEKLLYLTFDDGPDPDSTPQLLDILDEHSVKVLFFCCGEAAEKYPELVNMMISRGHLIGNHGYMHFDGLRTSTERYLENVFMADSTTSSVLFRPPFGRMRIKQYRRLRKQYRIIFWDIMPYDFAESFGSKRSLQILMKKMRPGSIIVLHDSPSSTANTITGEFITFAVSSGYRFEMIDFMRNTSVK